MYNSLPGLSHLRHSSYSLSSLTLYFSGNMVRITGTQKGKACTTKRMWAQCSCVVSSPQTGPGPCVSFSRGPLDGRQHQPPAACPLSLVHHHCRDPYHLGTHRVVCPVKTDLQRLPSHSLSPRCGWVSHTSPSCSQLLHLC